MNPLITAVQADAREKLKPDVTYIDQKFEEVASWAQELLNAFWVEQQKDLDEVIADTFEKGVAAGKVQAVEILSEYAKRTKTIKDLDMIEDAQRSILETPPKLTWQIQSSWGVWSK